LMKRYWLQSGDAHRIKRFGGIRRQMSGHPAASWKESRVPSAFPAKTHPKVFSTDREVVLKVECEAIDLPASLDGNKIGGTDTVYQFQSHH
ncbi:MAG: hypothetical protein JW795_04760, partial [Chitinivibrionales bacterium]|nr:hypothetical protein [Chitinivibrionales bacterium]